MKESFYEKCIFNPIVVFFLCIVNFYHFICVTLVEEGRTWINASSVSIEKGRNNIKAHANKLGQSIP